jgi:MoxR-like ATPase
MAVTTYNNVSDWQELELEITRESEFLDELLTILKLTIIGQEVLLERLVIGLLGNGHILLEGMPGLAKTLAVKTLAQAINALFSRIQFTPDILPADILGTMIYNIQTNEFTIKKGPVFANFVLADEINRAPEKVQSALLEVMQEQQVTIGNTTHKLHSPFMVLATQNPIDQAGTYELPEAQMDRFMLKVIISYPTRDEERLINRMNTMENKVASPSIAIAHILKMQELVSKIFIDEKVEDYILDIVLSTRWPEKYGLVHLKPYLKFGSSPRGGINLTLAARAFAFLKKRAFVIPADVYAVAPDVLRHRIGLNYAAMAEGITADYILQDILNGITAP